MTPNREIAAHSIRAVGTFVNELKQGTTNYRTIESLTAHVAAEYRGRCVMELIQNAHDALSNARSAHDGLISLTLITDGEQPTLYAANSGTGFTRRDFKGLCRLGQSPKNPNDSIGNKGLGFRSVLEVASAPEIWSTAANENDPGYRFRFHPDVRTQISDAIADLTKNGLEARSPFGTNAPLVDWTDDQLKAYRRQLRLDGVDTTREVMDYLSPYDFPLPITDQREYVRELFAAGHATVVCLPLDGGRGGDPADAVASVHDQLTEILDPLTVLFLPRLTRLVIRIDHEETTIERAQLEDAAFGDSASGSRQRVAVSQTPPDGEAHTTHYTVWTRTHGGRENSDEAVRIRETVKNLPNSWPEVDTATTSIAVQEGRTGAIGRLAIFLPTQQRTGTGAHIHAPFYGSLDRRGVQLDTPYNALLLEFVTDLTRDAIVRLTAGAPAEPTGQAIVDILGPLQGGETELNLLRGLEERASDEELLNQLPLLMCDTGWALASAARLMPDVPQSLPVGRDMWRETADFLVLHECLRGRRVAVKNLIRELGGDTAPTEGEWARTVARVAHRVKSGKIDSNWDGFLTSVVSALPPHMRAKPTGIGPDALRSAEFLPDTDGRLVAEDSAVQMFFRPQRGVDEEVDIDTVPALLRRRMAFLHHDVRTTEPSEQGVGRHNTAVQKFLDGRFVQSLRRADILRKVVLPALPPMPLPHDDEGASACGEILGWTLDLMADHTADDHLGDLPVATYGGWRPAREATFGPGWEQGAGEHLWTVCDALPAGVSEPLRSSALLPPDDPRWGRDVRNRGELLAGMGVAAGLRLIPVPDARFTMSQTDYELPFSAPPAFPDDVWQSWRIATQHQARPRYYVRRRPYMLTQMHAAPGLSRYDDLRIRGRRAFTELLLTSIPEWPTDWQISTIRDVEKHWHTMPITSPLAHWLSAQPWLSDGNGRAAVPLSARWLVSTGVLGDQETRFRHLRPLTRRSALRLEASSALKSNLVKLGLNVYPTGESAMTGPALLDALADAWRRRHVPKERFDEFARQVRHAWNRFDTDKDVPSRLLVRTGPQSLKIVEVDAEHTFYLPDDAITARVLREFRRPVLEIESMDAARLRSRLVEYSAIQPTSTLTERELVDGVEWTADANGTVPITDSGYRWLPPVLLTVRAYGGSNPKGTDAEAWTAARNRLRRARVLECDTIEVELTHEGIVVAQRGAAVRWLPGDVLGVTPVVTEALDELAAASQAMLGRRDLLKDLNLVLLSLQGVDFPTDREILTALGRAQIEPDAFHDVRDRWGGEVGQLARQVRPAVALLGADIAGLDAAAGNIGSLTA